MTTKSLPLRLEAGKVVYKVDDFSFLMRDPKSNP